MVVTMGSSCHHRRRKAPYKDCQPNLVLASNAPLNFTATSDLAWTLSAPEIVCYSLKGARVSGVTLKWSLREDAFSNESASNTSSRPLPAMFVTEVRTRSMAAKDAKLWTTLGTVSFLPFARAGAE